MSVRLRCNNCRHYGHGWHDCPYPRRLGAMRVKVPGTNVALLSRPSKMPGPSWSLPAGPACPFMRTGPNSICGSCYALGGKYTADPDVANAQWVRFEWTRRCMQSQAGVDEFVSTMVRAITDTRSEWMRVHDSGDLFSPTYTRAWIRVCGALSQVRFWFPTRSWQAPWVGVIRELNALPNVTVRPSALHFGDPAPIVEGLAAGTTALSDGYSCPAPSRGNHCGPCRRCWDEPEEAVSYHAVAGRAPEKRVLEVAA